MYTMTICHHMQQDAWTIALVIMMNGIQVTKIRGIYILMRMKIFDVIVRKDFACQ